MEHPAALWRAARGFQAGGAVMGTVTLPSGTAGSLGSQFPRGWYPDPVGRAALRWWDGTWWTSWVSDGTTVQVVGLPGSRPVHPGDLDALQFTEVVFIPELAARGALGPEQIRLATRLIGELAAQAYGQIPAELPAGLRERIPPASVPPDAGVWAGEPQPAPTVPVAATAPQPREPSPPGPLSRWWERTRESVRSDLAVHGLAYLGVLMFFIGAFGLVAFAFGDVQRELRPVAEVMIAAVPFAGAALLLRRGADVVGRALEVVGGLTAPIMIITSLLDGIGVPPDPHGSALVVAATAVCATMSAAYAAWVHRHPASGLRFVVAPMAWLAVAMATMGLGREIPANEGVATPGQAQVAATTAALVASVALARRRPGHALSGPTTTAAIPGLFILMTLAVLTWTAAPAPAVTVLVTTALAIMAMELLARRIGQPVVGLVAPWWLAFACSTVAGELGAPVAAALGVLGFLGLLEAAARAHRPGWALAIPAAAATALLLPTLGEPWLGVAILTTVAGWAILRRMRPFHGALAVHALDLGAALLPAAALIALGLASSAVVATAGAAGAVLVATIPATRPLLRRSPEDTFWPRWWQLALLVVGVGALVLGASYLTSSLVAPTDSPWLVVATLAGLTLAATLGPLPAALRPWPVLLLAASGWVLACSAVPLSAAVRGGVLAVAGLAQVVARNARPREPLAAGASGILAGHALGIAALQLLGWDPYALALGLTAATAGWAVTAAGTDRDRCPAGRWLEAVRPRLGYLPAAAAAAGLAVTTTAWLWAAGALGSSPNPLAVAFVGVAAVLAGLARLSRTRRVGAPLAVIAVLVGSSAAALATRGWPQAVCIAALIGVIAWLPKSRRPGPAVWLAWACIAPLGANVVYALSVGFRGLEPGLRSASALIVGGGLLAMGAAWADRRRGPAQARVLPRLPAARAPYLVGGLEVAMGTWLALFSPVPVATGWLLIGAAIAVLATAALMRVGGLSAAAVILAWSGTLLVVDFTPPTQSWPGLAVASALVGLAGWARWRSVPVPELERSAAASQPAVTAVDWDDPGAGTTNQPHPARAETRAAEQTRPSTESEPEQSSQPHAARAETRAGGQSPLVSARGARKWTPRHPPRPQAGTSTQTATTSQPHPVADAQPIPASQQGAGPAPAAAPWWARWDIGLLLGAGPVAATALVAAAGTSSAPATRVAVGLLAFAAAVILRRPAAVVLTGIGALLVLSGAAQAGPLWLALALIVASAALSWWACRAAGWLRRTLQLAGAAAAAAAWIALVAGLEWSAQAGIDATAVGAGCVALGAALLLGNSRLDRSWVTAWAGTAAALLAGTALAVQPFDIPGIAGLAPSGAVVLGLLLTSAASFIAASRTRARWLGDCGAVWAIAAMVVALQWQATGLSLAAAVLSVLAALGAAALLVPAIAGGPWRRPLIELGLALAAAAVTAAALVPDTRTPLVAALAAAALQAAAVGSALRLLWVQVLAPFLACAAWLVFADQARFGDPQWASMAVGLTVLVVVGMWRRDRAGRGAALAGPEIVAVELVGIAMLVGPALVQVVTASVGFSLLAVALGIGIAAWGVLTRVRRRLAAGVVTVLAALVLLVAVPLVELLPAWGGAGLWVLIAGLGIAAVVAASLLEQGRTAVRSGAARLATTTAGWE